MTQFKQLKVGRAKTSSGTPFRIKDARQYAADGLKKPDIFCGHCGKPVSYRAPKSAIDHFYHLASEDGSPACASESELHAAFKQAICDELNEHGLDPDIVRGFRGQFDIMAGKARTEVPVLGGKYRIDVVFKSKDDDFFGIEVIKSNPLTRAKRDEIIISLDMTMMVFRLASINERQLQDFMDIIDPAEKIAWARGMIGSIGFNVEGLSRPKKQVKSTAQINEKHFVCKTVEAKTKPVYAHYEPKTVEAKTKPVYAHYEPKTVEVQHKNQTTDEEQLYPGNHWCLSCAEDGVSKWASFGKRMNGSITWSCASHR